MVNNPRFLDVAEKKKEEEEIRSRHIFWGAIPTCNTLPCVTIYPGGSNPEKVGTGKSEGARKKKLSPKWRTRIAVVNGHYEITDKDGIREKKKKTLPPKTEYHEFVVWRDSTNTRGRGGPRLLALRVDIGHDSGSVGRGAS